MCVALATVLKAYLSEELLPEAIYRCMFDLALAIAYTRSGIGSFHGVLCTLRSTMMLGKVIFVPIQTRSSAGGEDRDSHGQSTYTRGHAPLRIEGEIRYCVRNTLLATEEESILGETDCAVGQVGRIISATGQSSNPLYEPNWRRCACRCSMGSAAGGRLYAKIPAVQREVFECETREPSRLM